MLNIWPVGRDYVPGTGKAQGNRKADAHARGAPGCGAISVNRPGEYPPSETILSRRCSVGWQLAAGCTAVPRLPTALRHSAAPVEIPAEEMPNSANSASNDLGFLFLRSLPHGTLHLHSCALLSAAPGKPVAGDGGTAGFGVSLP